MIIRRTLLAAPLAAMWPAAQVLAASFPTGPVKIVHPFPGGLVDLSARVIADRLGTAWKQPVTVEPKPGGNELIAGDAVAKSPRDGHTLLMCTEATFANNPVLYSKMPYDPNTDLAPVSELYDIQFGLVVRGDFPARNFSEFLSVMKRDGSKYSYASAGAGSSLHLAMESFRKIFGFEMLHVPYKAITQVIQDILGGRIDAWFASVPFVMPFVLDGKMRVLAVTGNSRLKSAPQVPTFAELGYPNVDYRQTVGLAVPSGTPAETIRQLQADIRNALLSKDFVDKVATPNELEVIGNQPQQFAEHIVARRESARKLIQGLGLRLD